MNCNSCFSNKLPVKSPFERIRLYLDGLDEVTSLERQQQIVRLAEIALPNGPLSK